MTSLEVSASGAAAEAIHAHVPGLVESCFASRLFAGDDTLWGPGAQSEASIRLGWTTAYRTSRPLLGQVRALVDQYRQAGLRHVILCGMGGSSLAPEVICRTYGVELTVLDSSNPDQVRRVLDKHLNHSVTVVASKSGSTVETLAHRNIIEQELRDRGIDPTTRMVVVSDPDSKLDHWGREGGFPVIHADPRVGGRFSALTAFGLIPAGLAGVDIGELLDDAESVVDLLSSDDVDNPALRLGAVIAGTRPLRDKLVIRPTAQKLPGFGDWAEQLVAESTGKEGRGVLPVVGAADLPATVWPDATTVSVGLDVDSEALGDGLPTETGSDALVLGSLGAQFMVWCAGTAVAGALLGVNPFDQPDVESAKSAALDTLQDHASDAPDVVEPVTLDQAAALVEELIAQIDPDTGYLAVMAYLDRVGQAEFAELGHRLQNLTGRPVTFGWGPRFLHSTGQLHKGGPARGVFLQITQPSAKDLPVPGQSYGLSALIRAQARGDAQVLVERGRPVGRIRLEPGATASDLLAALPQGG